MHHTNVPRSHLDPKSHARDLLQLAFVGVMRRECAARMGEGFAFLFFLLVFDDRRFFYFFQCGLSFVSALVRKVAIYLVLRLFFDWSFRIRFDSLMHV